MWKFTRNFIIPKWNPNQSKPTAKKGCKSNIVFCKQLTTISSYEREKSSDQNNSKKQHFNHFGNYAYFQFLLSRSLLFETAGWLGTVTILCLNLHQRQLKSLFHNDGTKYYCPFSRSVKATSENLIQDSKLSENLLPEKNPEFSFDTDKTFKAHVDSNSNILKEWKLKSNQYSAAIHNSLGLSSLDNNSKKAFRNFQAAARLGSCQGFYNLGLCYELGKGTKVNLSRAAFCYRKAAMKGHGMASFNLAIYFHKGLGGLPVDHETAKLLLEQAAARGIPEALIYLGLEQLEEEKWIEAYNIFSNLASKDNIDGKYYLGLCYENGWGVDKNEKIAAEMFFQNAQSGHPKSILELIRFHEEGLGGCDQDLDFALSLSQILADQGNSEGKEAVSRLNSKKQNIRKESLGINSSHLKTRKATLHGSSSVPELGSYQQTATKFNPISRLLSYLNLLTDFVIEERKEPCENGKPVFFIGENNMTHTYILHF
ncbi:death ligand signal enhancer [Caerostris darwini]|uniref:Death ligand signal enhancer n=1 Tax=Caerostris darwini TaxID=1538125 RepID=A0AAV4MNE7_9ARAC|nr:death ligand signal enhancer [Caerostris darwini]